MENLLNGDRLSTRAGLKVSRETIARFRQLIPLRAELIRDSYVRMRRIVLKAEIEEETRAMHLKRNDEVLAKGLDNARSIERARLAIASSFDAIFDFAERNIGRIQSQDGQAVFLERATKEKYLSLCQVLRQSYDREAAVLARVKKSGV
jgi:hypothetical protein